MSWMNDYAAPPDDDDDDRYAFRPATLGQRFLGAMIDALFNLVMLYIIRAAMDRVPWDLDDLAGVRAAVKHPGPLFVGTLVPLAFTAWLIHVRGQSLGKMLVGTRIVDEDGRRADLKHGFLLRTFPLIAVGLVPSLLMALGTGLQVVPPLLLLVSLASFVDAGMILGAYHRCLHDRIAGTYVAVAGTERPFRDEAAKRPRKKKAKRQRAPAAH